MTFLPVNAVSESEPLMLSDAGSVGTDAPLPSSSSFASGNDPRSNDAGQQASSAPNTSSSPPHAPSQLPPSSTMSPTIFALSLSSSTSQGSALESDGETDTTDTYASDTDAESDAPSTSTLGSSLHSPPLDDDMDAQARLEEIKLGTSDFEFEQAGYAPRIHTQDPGSYFPPVVLADVVPLPIPIPAHTQVADDSPSSGAGQTPPLSVLYPSPTSQQRALPARDALSVITDESSDNVVPSSHPEPPSTERAEVDVPSIPTLSSVPLSIMTGRGQDSMPNTPLAMSLALRKKIMLEALPSPALAPPSPFELDPLDASSAANRAVPKGRILLETSQTELDLLSGATDALEALAALNMAEESTTPHPGVAETPKDSPMLTLESMRASWDASARVGLGVEAGVAGARSGLGPSLSRRRMS